MPGFNFATLIASLAALATITQNVDAAAGKKYAAAGFFRVPQTRQVPPDVALCMLTRAGQQGNMGDYAPLTNGTDGAGTVQTESTTTPGPVITTGGDNNNTLPGNGGPDGGAPEAGIVRASVVKTPGSGNTCPPSRRHRRLHKRSPLENYPGAKTKAVASIVAPAKNFVTTAKLQTTGELYLQLKAFEGDAIVVQNGPGPNNPLYYQPLGPVDLTGGNGDQQKCSAAAAAYPKLGTGNCRGFPVNEGVIARIDPSKPLRFDWTIVAAAGADITSSVCTVEAWKLNGADANDATPTEDNIERLVQVDNCGRHLGLQASEGSQLKKFQAADCAKPGDCVFVWKWKAGNDEFSNCADFIIVPGDQGGQ